MTETEKSKAESTNNTILNGSDEEWRNGNRVCARARKHASTHTRTHACTHTRAQTLTESYTYTQLHTHTHTHTHTHHTHTHHTHTLTHTALRFTIHNFLDTQLITRKCFCVTDLKERWFAVCNERVHMQTT